MIDDMRCWSFQRLYIVYNSVRSMSLRKMVGMEAGLEDLQFEIKPKTLVFQGKVVSPFSIYLEKGVQVMGSFSSGNKHNSKETLYKFKFTEPAIFRLKDLSHATYTWNFYSLNPVLSSEDYQDSVSVDLMRTIELYGVELLEKEREIQTSFKERNPSRKLILDIWRRLRRQMRNSRLLLKCIFPKLMIHLEFQLQIKNSLDLEIYQQQNRPALAMKKSMSEPEIRTQSVSERPLKSNIADPLIIKDEYVTHLLEEAKSKHMKMDKKKSPLHQLLKTDLEPQNNNEDFQIKAVVTNPKGIIFDIDNEGNSFEDAVKQKETNKLSPPLKKFSMLSDIIERSHEGSSTYGGGADRVSSSDRYPDRKDEILALGSSEGFQPKNKVTVDSPLLNKFKTLPHDNYKQKFLANEGKADLRRAHTAEKQQEKIQENEYSSVEQYQNGEETKDDSGVSKPTSTSGDPYAKYIIVAAIVIILGFLGQSWFNFKDIKSAKPKPAKPKTKVKI